MSDITGVILTSSQVAQPLNGFDSHGAEWSIDPEQFSGWFGSPASTLSAVQKQRAPGAYLSPRDLGPRSLSIGGLLEADDADGLRDARDRLIAACDLDACKLAVTEGSQTRTVTCYRQDEVIVTEVHDTLAKWSIAMTATDPLKYGPTISAGPTALPSSSGGLTFPATFPVVVNGVTSSGVLHIDNAGNLPARIGTPVMLRVQAGADPVVGPRVTHVQSGRTIALGYTLPAGAFLDFDMTNRKIREGGTASRNTFISSRGWFLLAPGPNDLIFGADVINTTAQLSATYAPANL